MPTPVENFSTGVFPFCDLIGWTKLKGVRRCRLERRLSGVGCWQCEVMGRQVDRRGMALHLASAKNKVEAEETESHEACIELPRRPLQGQ